jgi:hypothetical protein
MGRQYPKLVAIHSSMDHQRPQPEHQRRSIVIYQKPSISAAIEAVKAVKGHSKSISNTDSNMPTVAAYEADE